MTRLLARWRVFLGFVFAAVVLWLATPTWRSLAIGAAIAVAGELLRLWAAGHLEKSKEVTRSGPYRFTRHPLYLGPINFLIGLSLTLKSWFAAVLTLGVAIWFHFRVLADEASLARQLGAPYVAYTQRVKRWIPGVF